MAAYILAHDLGTTGNKATLYDDEGHLVASKFVGYKTDYPEVNLAEQDPFAWWNAVCESTQALIAESHVDVSAVKVVSFSGQMMGCLPVDKQGNPLRSSIIWADQRSVKQARHIEEKVGAERFYRITGHRISPTYSVEKMMWVKENQPHIYKETYKFLQAKDFIICRLVGKFVTDYSDATGTNLYDINQYKWSEEILAAAGIDADKLPEVYSSFHVAGEITPAAAEEVGLKPGTPVVIGGGDGACATAGAGIFREGSAYVYVGSSSWIASLSSKPFYDERQRTSSWLSFDHTKYKIAGTMQSAGGSYSWLRDTLCGQEVRAGEELGLSEYQLMDLQAKKSKVGSGGLLFLPYLMGERSPHWNPNARACFVGLTQKHTRADMIRSVLEGVALNLKIILDCFAHEVSISDIRVIGGGAQGAIWRQIMADVFNKRMLLPQFIHEATSLGAAIAGGIGVGIFKGFDEVEKLNPIREVVTPDAERVQVYAKLYPTFIKAYESLMEVFDELAEV